MRPESFRLNADSPYAAGLVFAGLGQHVFGAHYHDSSEQLGFAGNHGTLSGMTPATDWVWDSTLNRAGFETGGSPEFCQLPLINISGSWSVAAWINAAVLTTAKLAMFDNLNTAGYAEGVSFVAGNAAGSATRTIGIYSAATGWSESITQLPAAKTLTHVGVSVNAAVGVSFYINGKLDVFRADTTSALVVSPVTAKIGKSYLNTYVPSWFGDVLVWDNAQSAETFARLADPSNVMLDGLILPPTRRLFPVAVAGATSIPIFMHHYKQLTGAN